MKNMQIVSTPKISDAEWEIMRVIWTNEPVTSRTITEVLSEKMDWKAATIKTLIGRLVKKGSYPQKQMGIVFYIPHLYRKKKVCVNGPVVCCSMFVRRKWEPPWLN